MATMPTGIESEHNVGCLPHIAYPLIINALWVCLRVCCSCLYMYACDTRAYLCACISIYILAVPSLHSLHVRKCIYAFALN